MTSSGITLSLAIGSCSAIDGGGITGDGGLRFGLPFEPLRALLFTLRRADVFSFRGPGRAPAGTITKTNTVYIASRGGNIVDARPTTSHPPNC